jgi:predicted dehydrogenase
VTVPTLGVAMLGYAFMGEAHSRALAATRQLDAPLVPELVSLCGRDGDARERARARLGWSEGVADWREQVADDRVGLFVNGAPNSLHAEPTIAAAHAGKHVLCEKPLARDAAEAWQTWQAADAAGVVHMTAFNYRFVPAVRAAREILAAGDLGEIVHFRARYLQSWGWDAPPSWRFDARASGTGAIGDLGAHSIDLARFLVGEITSVSAVVRTFVPGREVDDAYVATVEFESGAIGTLEASRLATGHANHHTWEINGSRGSLAFDLERMNELLIGNERGFRRVLEHGDWWPPGHIVGWGDTFTYEYLHLLGAIAGRHPVAPAGATFADGYRCAEVCDAIGRAAVSRANEEVEYR